MKKHQNHIAVLLLAILSLTVSAQAQDKIAGNLKAGFSGEQGKNNWSYEYVLKDGTYKKIETFDAEKNVWKGPRGWWEFGAIANMVLFPGYQNDVALTWTSPSDGKLYVGLGNFTSQGDTQDGVQICVKYNDEVVWPKEGGFHLLKAKGEKVKAGVLNRQVKAGDTLRFIVNRVGKHQGDRIQINPYISFTPSGS